MLFSNVPKPRVQKVIAILFALLFKYEGVQEMQLTGVAGICNEQS